MLTQSSVACTSFMSIMLTQSNNTLIIVIKCLLIGSYLYSLQPLFNSIHLNLFRVFPKSYCWYKGNKANTYEEDNDCFSVEKRKTIEKDRVVSYTKFKLMLQKLFAYS